MTDLEESMRTPLRKLKGKTPVNGEENAGRK